MGVGGRKGGLEVKNRVLIEDNEESRTYEEERVAKERRAMRRAKVRMMQLELIIQAELILKRPVVSASCRRSRRRQL